MGGAHAVVTLMLTRPAVVSMWATHSAGGLAASNAAHSGAPAAHCSRNALEACAAARGRADEATNAAAAAATSASVRREGMALVVGGLLRAWSATQSRRGLI